jgi:hypothetical protein
MSQAKYYAPKITRDLISKLYWEAQSQRIPMTKLADQIIAEGLVRYHDRRRWKRRSSTFEEQLFFDFGVINSGDVLLTRSLPLTRPLPRGPDRLCRGLQARSILCSSRRAKKQNAR